MMRPGNFCKW